MNSLRSAKTIPAAAQFAVVGAAIGLAVIAVLASGSLGQAPRVAPQPTPFDQAASGLALEGSAPGQRYATAAGTWYGLNVRFCNQATTAITYVSTTAVLFFADGTKATARNGYGPGPRGGGAPEWLGDATQWMDKATLRSGDCATGWLVFYSIISPAPERLDWDDLSLEVASAF